jgi:glutathione S-transferase
MKLYSLPASPFAARCRMQIYAKGLPIDIVPPPGGHRSDVYAAINPLRRIPSLDTGQGVIPESDTILEYIEERYPTPSLLPDTPLGRSRARLLRRIADLYVMEPMLPLLALLETEHRDKELMERQLKKIEWGVKQLDNHVDDQTYAVGRHLTTADCTLVPTLLYVTALLPQLGVEQPLRLRERLAAYWERVHQDCHARRVLDEMREALPGVSTEQPSRGAS